MGTVVSFTLEDPVADHVVSEVKAWLQHVDDVFSTYRPGSDISRLDRGELRLADCDPEVADVLDLCAEATEITEGYFSATATGHLDPSGLVKGWAIERASDLLTAAGCHRHAVNGGGDVQTSCGSEEEPPWNIGILDPQSQQILATVRTWNSGIATSGTAERGHHVINPQTGRPADYVASITVVCSRLTTADVLATAAMARGPSAVTWLESLNGPCALAVTTFGEILRTTGWPTDPLMPAAGSAKGRMVLGEPPTRM